MIAYRRADLRDAGAIASLHARSWRESYRGEFTDAFLDGDLDAERLEVWNRRLRRPPENQFVQIALDGSDLLGFVCAYGDHDPRWGSFVDNLHVARSVRKTGVGRALMRWTGAWLASHHPARPVYLLVLESNAGARRFYERIGAENAEVFTTETHGGAIVRSCRYVWRHPNVLKNEGATA